MITPQEFVARWRWGPLVQAEPAALEGIEIPEVSKRFLIEAGLPTGTDFEFCWDWLKQGLPSLRKALEDVQRIRFWRVAPEPGSLRKMLEDTKALPPEFDRYRVIGEAGDRYICFDEAANWCLVSVHLERSVPLSFINSSVPQFAYFLLIHEEYLSELSELPMDNQTDAKVSFAVRRMRVEFRWLDPEAMKDAYCYWSEVLEGLLI